MTWTFNEEFMEDCVEESPQHFIGEPCKKLDRQPQIGGFRPDLILQDQSQRTIVVEIQQKALDRYHLYKTLEYRDLYANQEGVETPRIILISESIRKQHEQLLATHNIEHRLITRARFVSIAVKHCNKSVSKALNSPDTNSSNTSKIASVVHNKKRDLYTCVTY